MPLGFCYALKEALTLIEVFMESVCLYEVVGTCLLTLRVGVGERYGAHLLVPRKDSKLDLPRALT